MTEKVNESPIAVSVIIPAYNAERWIVETLRSATMQNISGMEIVVVDDGSTDRTATFVKSQFSDVKLIQSTNCGPSHARNLGTAAASGKYIQYLDADDLLCPEKLAIQMEALDMTGADVAYGDWQSLSLDSPGNYFPGEITRLLFSEEPEIALFTNYWAPLAAYLFRSTIVQKVGSWNEKLPILQDVRFVLDCALRDAKFVYCPRLVAQYRKHLSGSVSSKSSIAFTRDCLTNAVDIETWWQTNGGISEQRREALLSAYSYVVRSSFGKDFMTFETAFNALKRLSPRGKYVPKSPKSLRLASQVFGYRNAETLAAMYRHAKKRLHLLNSADELGRG